jgi:hypothetical protein
METYVCVSLLLIIFERDTVYSVYCRTAGMPTQGIPVYNSSQLRIEI